MPLCHANSSSAAASTGWLVGMGVRCRRRARRDSQQVSRGALRVPTRARAPDGERARVCVHAPGGGAEPQREAHHTATTRPAAAALAWSMVAAHMALHCGDPLSVVSCTSLCDGRINELALGCRVNVSISP